MAYTVPPTFAATDPLAAAELNVLGDDIAYLKAITDGVNMSGTQVSRVGVQSVPDSTDTPISWTAEVFDYGGWWTSGANIVVPAGAIPAGFTTIMIQATARVTFAINGTGFRRMMFLNNGTEFSRTTQTAISGDQTDFVVVDYAEVAAGDIITAEVHQTSGGSLDMSAKMSVIRHAPAA